MNYLGICYNSKETSPFYFSLLRLPHWIKSYTNVLAKNKHLNCHYCVFSNVGFALNFVRDTRDFDTHLFVFV